MRRQIFILSPAKTTGERVKLLFNPNARFELAQKLQRAESVALAQIFSFLSGLYFRGKFTYAQRFAAPPPGLPGAVIITSNRGLLPAETPVALKMLKSFADVPIDLEESRYLKPLERHARAIRKAAGPDCSFILLGSISTGKYAEPLLRVRAEQLLFPSDFVGRGDMSRGGLMLRCVAEGREMEYIPIKGAQRHGKRPPKLAPKSWGYKILSGHTGLDSSGLII